jgi:TMEM175 potassium channel family protein
VRRERTVAFSDGVFAIAITLLVLTIQIPDLHTESSRQLDRLIDDELPDLIAYFIGFYVIGGFWYRHHRFFDSLRGFDPALLVANMIFLSLIALLPFPTAVLGDHPGLKVAVVMFAVAVALAGVADAVMLWLALRRGLLSIEEEHNRRKYVARSLVAPVIFVVSIPLTFAHPTAAICFWLAGLAVGPRIATRLGWIRPW